MGILRKHTVKSVITFGTLLSFLLTLILCSVDLFTNLDTYTTNNVSTIEALKLTLMFAPQALMMSIGFAFMLSVLYYLAMFHTSNEIICVLNSGVSYLRVLRPIIITSLFVSAFCFVFNEQVAIRITAQRDAKMRNISSISESYDSQNIALADVQNKYMVYAKSYIDAHQTLLNVTHIYTPNERLIRTNAQNAKWVDDHWIFYDVYVYEPLPDGTDTKITYYDVLDMSGITIEPQMFRNISNEISTMELRTAINYVKKMKGLNPEQYASMATELYQRLFTCLTPFVLMLISCSMNFRFKKNAFFIVLVVAIGLAVVYFVVRMVTLLMAEQGVIPPYMGSLFPFIVIVTLSTVFTISTRR